MIAGIYDVAVDLGRLPFERSDARVGKAAAGAFGEALYRYLVGVLGPRPVEELARSTLFNLILRNKRSASR